MLFEVAIKSPLRKLFTYESEENLEQGARVRVPFGSRKVTGFVWRSTEVSPPGLKKILEILDKEPLFDQRTLLFYERAANYYGISLGELLGSSLPQKVREGKPIPDFETKHFVPNLPALSAAQEKVFKELQEGEGFRVELLQGETGSGKTEIYLKLMEKILMAGGQALLLVPEISLTPQLEDRLQERLGGRVSVFHSQMKESKRIEAFARALRGESDIFLGARSALMLPFKKLELIVVDEEHDGSYKQSERGPYHARDLALLRAQIFSHLVLLGSATPSLESFQRQKDQGKRIFTLPPFFEKKVESKFEIVGLKQEWEKGDKSFISQPLHSALEETLQKKEQSLLFLNRRGSASQRICVACGSVDECKHCSVTLTMHNDSNLAICHWCNYQKKILPECDVCGEKQFFMGGIGTKEIEVQIKARFPEAKVERLDRDRTQKRNLLPEILRDFASGKIDILIGTQMISKGLDIPRLTTVAIILADQGWGVPDFRAQEKAFQLLTQLKGRAGRRGQNTRILVQTFQPEHPLFQWVDAENSFDLFAEKELEVRKMAQLPPFTKLGLWTLQHKSEDTVQAAAHSFVKKIRGMAEKLNIEVIGPAPAPIYRWKGLYRMHILTKTSPKAPMSTFVTAVLDHLDQNPLPASLRFDRDPYQFM